jgi:hypothetical protein
VPSGVFITVEAFPLDSIGAIKGKIEVSTGIPANMQRIVFRSSDLADDSTVSGNNMQNADRIDVMLRLAGGGGCLRCFGVVFFCFHPRLIRSLP